MTPTSFRCRLASLLALGAALAAPVTISNSLPRRDVDGDILEAGDGCLNYDYETARYYLWGARYQPCAEPNNDCYETGGTFATCAYVGYVPAGECCGWRNMTIAVYSSADLVSWRKEGLNILPVMQDYATPYNAANQGFMEVCGVYSRKTGFWNLWFLNAARPYYISTAVSRSAGGPYEIVNWNSGVAGTADLYLYHNVSADTLLLQYNAGADVFVCTVKDDFLTVDACVVGSQHNQFGYIEGGGVFQWGDSVFVMAGHGCCFCTLGSNGYVWRSDDGPLGNYSFVGDVVPRNPDGSAVTHAQQFGITPVYTTQGFTPVYIGIRFGQAPDGHKNHDPQYWSPFTFNAAGNPEPVTWVDNFTLDLAPPPAPAPVPAPAPPWFRCSLSSSNACFEVPADFPGAFAAAAECAAACPAPLCALSGTWWGVPNATGAHVSIEQTPLNATAAAVTISCPQYWSSNTTGVVRAGGTVVVGAGGFCGSPSCMGSISQLEPGGSACAKITWSNGVWCNPAADARCA